MRPSSRRWLQGLVALAAAAALSLGGAARASAHTHIDATEPADGALLVAAPEQVLVDFSERLEPSRSTAGLTDDTGATSELPAVLDPEDPSRLLVRLPVLRDGVYRVTYRAFGADDLHEVAGSIVFGVGVAPTAAGGQTATPTRAAEVVARATTDAGFAVTAAAVLLLWALPRMRPRVRGQLRAKRATRAAASLGLVAILVGIGTALVDDTLAVGGPFGTTMWRVLTSSAPGRRAVLTFEAVAILGALVALQRPGPRMGRALRVPTAWPGSPTPAEVGSVAAVLGLAGALSIGGHTGSGIPSLADAGVHVVHLLAGGTWVGSLLLLPLIVRTTDLGWTAALRALAPLAEGLVLVTVTTGLLLAAGRTATVTALLAPGYGWIVLGKVAAIAAAVALGLRVLQRAKRGSAARGWTRRAEVLVAGALVGLGSTLAATPPAAGPIYEPAPAPPATAWSGAAGDLAVRLSLSPNRPGTNLVRVDVHDTRRPPPGPITAVSVSGAGAEGATPIRAQRRGAGSWDVGSVTLGVGETRLVVAITRPGLPDARSSLTWTVPPALVSRHRTIVSTARLRPAVDVAALAGAACGALVLRRRHHHQEAPDAHDHRHHPRTPLVAAAQDRPHGPDARGRPRGDRARRSLVGR